MITLSLPTLHHVIGRSTARSYSATAVLSSAFNHTNVLFQKKKAAAGGGKAAAIPVEVFDLKKVIPVNLKKEGVDPEIKPDSEYPPWLFKILEPKPSFDELMMNGIENVPPEHMKRVARLASKSRTKMLNAASAKK